MLLLSGCRLPLSDRPATDTDYFPLQTGHYVIYDVEEQRYSSGAAPVLRVYQLKEMIGQPYADVTGQPASRLIRYRRTDDSEPWQPDSVWAARLIDNEAVRTENGRDFVALFFPISNGQTWNTNRRNPLGRDDLTISNAGQPFRVQTKAFDETVTVTKPPDSTLLAFSKGVAVYARQVGLIYRERVNVQFCTATPACTGHAQIESGTQQIYRIRTYGTE